RLYRRDPAVARKEEALLRRGWRSFRVPRVLEAGEDFLLLEHVPHRPLEGSEEHGAAAGRALAEIHSVSFERAGELDASLEVRQPWDDLVGTLREYVASLSQGARVLATIDALAGELRARSGTPVLLHADFKASNLHWTDS